MSFSLSKTHNQGVDMVSICVYCREDGTTLLSMHPDEELARFPFIAIMKTSWRLTVRKLINMISGLSGKEIAIMRITKFWVPEHPNVFHILYKVKCPLTEKKGIKLQGGSIPNLKWFSLEQVQQMCLTGLLTSPELLEYVMQTLQPSNYYPLTADPEASKEGFDMLNEVAEKNIIVNIDNSFLTPQEQLLKVARFTRNDQKKIYKEFWLRTFPNLLMNHVQFERFVAELGWRKSDWPGLFACADVSSVGGMTFRDLLMFLAATEPDTPHGTGSGEIRCQYIFRYFDRNRDNLLDQTELRALVVAISSVKGNIKSPAVDKLVESYMSDLGLGSKQKLSMTTFIKKVGELKFRGTSSIFRSTTSVLKVVPPIDSVEKNIPSQPVSSTIKSAGFAGISALKGISTLMPSAIDNVAEFMKDPGKNKIFEIATHAIRLTKDGLLDDVRPIDRVSHGKSLSLEREDHFLRLPSLLYYNEKSPANELLVALAYFAYESPVRSKNATYKQAFNWGKYDMDHFISLMQTVCEKCIKLLEKESRMLHLTSPIYILGDLHGNYPDLTVFEKVLWNLGLALSPSTLLFLGDYVDRGAYGVETVAYLFAQKLKNPNKIFLLRGNHEVRQVQKAFTFYVECQRKFGEDQFYDVWNMINRVFDNMPLAAVIDDKLFCCHGGIPSPWLGECVKAIQSIPCPLTIPDEESQLAWEIMWNDPVRSDQVSKQMAQEMAFNEGFATNVPRKTGKVFSLEALDTFLKKNNLSHVIRAHEVKTAGFQIQQGGKLLTVFSSSGYCGGPNEAACIFVCQDKIRVLRINTS